MILIEQLKRLDSEIKVAVIGIGSIGKGLVYQCHLTPGIKPVVICDIHIEKAIQAAQWISAEYDIVNSVKELNETLRSGKVAVCNDGELAASSEQVDVLIEASSAILQGAKHVLKGIEYGQHIVMMNYEAEMMYGPYLLKKATEAGLVYTCADGDQPTVIKTLVDEMTLWGFDLVMAGNMKGFMDRYTDPIKIAPEADKRNLDHKMCSSYTDGSKLCVEMAVLANALNLRADVPGMHGAKIKSIYDIFDHYDFEAIYKDKKGVVDYVLGAQPVGGVFAIGYTADKFQQYTLDWFPPNMGPKEGPFYLFYRPYHLGHIEAMACVAEAFLHKSARLQPTYGMKTNVFAYAKKDLKEGESLDGMGGFAAYGLIENLEDDKENPGIPICIAENMKLKRAIPKDEKIRLQDLEFDHSDPSYQLYLLACSDLKIASPVLEAAPNGAHTNGVHSNGVHSNGVHSNGVYSNGVHSNGVHSNGVHSNGIHSNGVHSNGVASHVLETASNGIPSNGIPSNGTPSTGVAADGVAADGVALDGDHSNGVEKASNGVGTLPA